MKKKWTKELILRAGALFEEGYSCSQAIAIAFGPTLGLDEKRAALLSTAFGSGTCGRAGMCGAINGAMIIIGLAHGRIDSNDKAARDKTYELGAQLISKFEEKYSSAECRNILGIDISDPALLKQAKDEELFQRVCVGVVTEIAEILVEILSKEETKDLPWRESF